MQGTCKRCHAAGPIASTGLCWSCVDVVDVQAAHVEDEVRSERRICRTCGGSGWVTVEAVEDGEPLVYQAACLTCNGAGVKRQPPGGRGQA